MRNVWNVISQENLHQQQAMASPGEEALRSQMADLSMALARNEALITLFSTTLQSSGVIPEAVGLGVANQHNNSISRASSLITACMSSVKITPDKFRLIVEALTKVGMQDSADRLLAVYSKCFSFIFMFSQCFNRRERRNTQYSSH